jgi:hypothetical protein
MIPELDVRRAVACDPHFAKLADAQRGNFRDRVLIN